MEQESIQPQKPSQAGPSRAARDKPSQRQVKSCGFCYRRKVKCDKTFPCTRCVKRGLGDLCHQETQIVNGEASSFNVGDRLTRREPTYAELVNENKALHRKLASQEQALGRGYRARSIEERPNHHRTRFSGRPIAVRLNDEETDDNDITASTCPTPEGEAAYRDADEQDGVDSVSQVRDMTHMMAGNPARLATVDHKTITTLSLINPALSHYLVQYHSDTLHWVHCVYHKPSFMREYEYWMSIRELMRDEAGGKGNDFLALYFSILACSMYYADGPIPGTEGLGQDALNLLPHLWFDTAINCLHMSGFMARPTLPALQAICILPLIAPTFGASAYMTTLLHTALKLSRELGFHNLVADTPDSTGHGSVRRELGRRIWACLAVAEGLDPAAIAPGALIYPVEGRPVIGKPGYQVTGASHLIAMTRLSRICRDQSFELKGVVSPTRRWAIARQYDERLSHVLDFCPRLNPFVELAEPDTTLNSGLGWLEWSRFMWVLTTWKLRMMFYRAFFRKSYSDPKYALAREVCIEGSRRIMAAWDRPRLPHYTKSWPISADTIFAGMILATEYLRGSYDQQARTDLRLEVENCIDVLLGNADQSNAVVPRGVELLRQMLDRGVLRTHSLDAQEVHNPSLLSGSADTRTVYQQTVGPAVGQFDAFETTDRSATESAGMDLHPAATCAIVSSSLPDDFSFFTDFVQSWDHMVSTGPATGELSGGFGQVGDLTFGQNHVSQENEDFWNALFFSM
ncbi:hypothetical protein IAU59_000044 [Kwoniella sp. CBS 9459]